jgi:diguanylate cyclase (GGDEF)-like protein/PAS domain S-box-containing protein
MKSSVVVIPSKPTIAPKTKPIGLAPRAAIGRASDAANDDRALQALRASESRYHRLFETAQDGILLLNADTAQIEDVNPYLIEMLGYSHAEFLGKKLWEVGSFADIAQSKEMFAELQTKGYVRYDDLPLKTRAGMRIAVEFVSNTYDCEGIKVIQCNIRNITERKADQSKIQRHTRLYAALSQCNKAIVHCVSEEESLQQICRAAVQFGGMKMAWVCFVDTKTLMVRPGASFGDDTEYLRSLNISVDADSPLGHGPTATAIRENRPFWCQDFLNDPLTAPWHDRAAHAGFAASASLPLHSKGIVVGAFTLYSGAANCFDESARDLLLEMAADISFALDNFTGESQRRLVEEALVRASHRNQVFLRNASDGVHILDADGTVVEVSDSFCEMLGYPREELIGANVSLWDTQRSPQELRRLIAAQMAKKGRSVFETRHRRRDGSFLDAEVTGQSLELDGKPVLFNSARDITERKLAENRIKRLNRVYAMLSGIATLIVRVRDRQVLYREACNIAVGAGQFRLAWIGMVNRDTQNIDAVAWAGDEQGHWLLDRPTVAAAGSRRIGLAARAIATGKYVVCNDIEADKEILAYPKEALARGHRSVIALPLIVDSEPIGALHLYAGDPNFFDAQEITLLNELAGDISFAIDHLGKQERLDYLAYYDALTGLANRTLFLERVAQYVRSAVSGGHKLAVFLIDLERFKNINDSLGRPAGDALLRQVTEWLTRCAGDANLLARIGADHFAVVMPEVRQGGDVARLLEKIMAAFLEHPFRLNDAVFRIAFKVGAAMFPDDGADADTLFKHAEAALKKAKASGERYLFYTETMTATMATRLTLENQLRQALDNGEFVLHYQPKVNLVSGQVTGAEALIRWNDPRTGLMPPGRFIPVLEETGLIHAVGRWAVHQAIADYLRWRAAGLPAVRIAVNVSALQLRHRGFVAEIEEVIGIDAQAATGLELEITESVIMADVTHSIATLQALRAMNVTIAIDDFGTGFSSLSYLAKLPVDTLKIDRSFVIDMTAGPEGLALVSTIINLAHSLKLKVVAEGVETEEHSRLLRLLGCDEMQGFLLSEAVPSEIFETRYLASPPAGR